MFRLPGFGRLLLSAAALFILGFPLVRLWAAPNSSVGRTAFATAVIALAGASLAAASFLISSYHARELRRRVESLLYVGQEQPVFKPAPDEMDALAATLELAARRVRVMVEALQRGSGRLEAILGSMVEGVAAVDPLLRITFVNRAFAEMMGVALPI